MPYDENGKYMKHDYKKKGYYTVETAKGRRRTIRKVYDLPNGTISVVFPKFVSELQGVASEYKTDSVQELISLLQGMCLAEGLRPCWKKFEDAEVRQFRLKKERVERAKRLVDARKRHAEERAKLAESFPERVKKTRNTLGDF